MMNVTTPTRSSARQRRRVTAGGTHEAGKNLILVVRRSRNEAPSFRQVARYVQELCPEIRPVIVRDAAWNHLRGDLWWRPTLAVSLTRLRYYRPLRGTIRQGNPLKKSEEYQALAGCNIPVPRWKLLTKEQLPDLTEFGRHVVVKPDFGGRGAEVRIWRKGRVRWKPLTHFRGKQCQDSIVQEFVFTGHWPVSYRVLSLFGKALWCTKHQVPRDRVAVPDASLKGFGGSIVATASKNPVSLCDDAEVIALAERAHAAFPEIPALGVDVVREQPSGKLFVLEVNACGQVWHFSSPIGQKIQRDWGFRYDAQFNGLRRAAAALVDQTHQLAR